MPSLVGSEMCIRDSPNTPRNPHHKLALRQNTASARRPVAIKRCGIHSLSVLLTPKSTPPTIFAAPIRSAASDCPPNAPAVKNSRQTKATQKPTRPSFLTHSLILAAPSRVPLRYLRSHTQNFKIPFPSWQCHSPYICPGTVDTERRRLPRAQLRQTHLSHIQTMIFFSL